MILSLVVLGNKVLIIGSGPIVVGQACEFDYSAVQACEAFKEEGYCVVLLNNNPATVMTDVSLSYKTYINPINKETLFYIIKKEKPDYIYSSVGGQTSLNIILEIKENINGIKLLGPSINSILISENRELFRKTMRKNNLNVSLSYTANNLKQAVGFRDIIIKKTGLESISIRPSYTLGGMGGGLTNNIEGFIDICNKAFLTSNNSILIEESLYGNKELELEVLRDDFLNFIVVCCIENIDPVGIHTGDSCCIVPFQTLTDSQYQIIRYISLLVSNSLNIKSCGFNIQFSISKKSGCYKIIEVNPRLSRSSALASKATGFSISRVSSKISLGYSLFDLKHETTQSFNYSCEPTIDYIVFKCPNFSFEKFGHRNFLLGSQMKSIGESMSISNNIESSFKLGFLSLHKNPLDYFGNCLFDSFNLYKRLRFFNSDCYKSVYWCLRLGFKVSKINYICNIDSFYIIKLRNIVRLENTLRKRICITVGFFKLLKRNGFSDSEISKLLECNFKKVFEFRKRNKIFPFFRRIDSCSGLYNSYINYFYCTYSGFCEFNNSYDNVSIIILGSGPNSIGQGIEFDYCCVHASNALKEIGLISNIINCNPETVSTDYNISSNLFFLPVSFESLFDIFFTTRSYCLITQFCGQLSKIIIDFIKTYNIRVLGTQISDIVASEDRCFFNSTLSSLSINVPKNIITYNPFSFRKILNNLNLPILVRPSYVLGGMGMKVINSVYEFQKYYNIYVSNNVVDFPILVDYFLKGYKELDIDGLNINNNFVLFPIIRHVELAGIHSGDSGGYISNSVLDIPPIRNIYFVIKELVSKLNIFGVFNIQIAYKKDVFYILELNTRASRTIPFISKCIGINIIDIAVRSMIDSSYYYNFLFFVLKTFFKESIFSNNKFFYCDSALGPEMKSTGEVFSYGKNIFDSYYLSQVSSYPNLVFHDSFLFILSKATKKVINNIKLLGFCSKRFFLYSYNIVNHRNNFLLLSFFNVIDKFSVILSYGFKYFRVLSRYSLYYNSPTYTTYESIILLLNSLRFVYTLNKYSLNNILSLNKSSYFVDLKGINN